MFAKLSYIVRPVAGWFSASSASLLALGVALLILSSCGGGEPAPAGTLATPPPTTSLEEGETAVPEGITPAEQNTPVPLAGAAQQVPPPAEYAQGAASELEPHARDGMYSEPPPMIIDPSLHYYATLKTERGDIRIQLFADRAPLTVNNFVFLANEGFYNDTSFHRVLDGFMAQAGDPTGTGAGGPGYTFEDELHPGLMFDQAGLLAMANRGVNTNGSQFFLTFGPTEWLDFRHTIFGKVIEGEDVMANLSLRDPAQQLSTPGDTLYTVLIEETENSVLPTPTPMPPTPTPTTTPTPFAPTQLEEDERPLGDLPPVDRVNYFNQPPAMILTPGDAYTATISTTQGDLTIALAADTHPEAVNNFVVLARLGFYDDTPISLVRPDDSIIFGVPDNNPLNDAGYKFPAEMGVGIDPERGSLAYIPFEILDDGTMLSSSSQILIALIRPAPQFKEQLSFFGRIVDGDAILNRLSMEDTITRIEIIQGPAGAPLPETPQLPDAGSPEPDDMTDDEEEEAQPDSPTTDDVTDENTEDSPEEGSEDGSEEEE